MADELFLNRYGTASAHLGLQIGKTVYPLQNTEAWETTLYQSSARAFVERARASVGEPLDLAHDRLLAPITEQQIWASGVTYKRSEEAREAESSNSTIYTRVYSAERPELFFKGLGRDAVGPEGNVGIRFDASWSVPEPELVVVLNNSMEVIGFTIGNDMSSRDIEGANPLYLPQAKVYEKSCAIGPRIWLQPGCTAWPDLEIKLTILRDGKKVFHDTTHTRQIKRTLSELVDYLGCCQQFYNGVYLFTGTGVVPPDGFTLQAGDEIRIVIDPIGELVNRVEVVGRPRGAQPNPQQHITNRSTT